MPQEHVQEFLASTSKFGSMLTEAVSTVSGGVELRMPDGRFTDSLDMKPSALANAAADEDTLHVGPYCSAS